MGSNDTQLQRDVIEELRWDPSVSEADIAVSMKDGVVTLAGTVDSYTQKLAAERAAARVVGVRDITADLTVRLPASHRRSDIDIAHAASSTLSWDADVPRDKVQARVRDGWITLDGTVEWRYQSAAAEAATRRLVGVVGVVNRIIVKPAISASDVKHKIERALERSAHLHADRINVAALAGRVFLTGTVRTWAERSDAERAAWAAPGVVDVDDQIAVVA